MSVNVNGEVKVFKEDQLQQVKTPKFDCSNDMADLTYLSDACVLWNSVIRYVNELIYTYSGLFASQSILIRGFRSTPFAPWNCMWLRGARSALLISLLSPRVLTKE